MRILLIVIAGMGISCGAGGKKLPYYTTGIGQKTFYLEVWDSGRNNKKP
jgi:hypothetical protein